MYLNLYKYYIKIISTYTRKHSGLLIDCFPHFLGFYCCHFRLQQHCASILSSTRVIFSGSDSKLILR